MHPIEYTLEFAEIMLDELRPYLHSKEVFWNLGESPSSGGAPFPKMSIGALALTMDELGVQGEEMGPKQIQRLEALNQSLDDAKAERPVNLEAKALSEVQQRFNLWKAYVQDLRESATAAESYSTDVRQRVLLTRLRAFIADEEAVDDLEAELEPVDDGLRAIFRSGPFAWHPRLRLIYHAREYWFLYGEPVPQPD